MVYIKGGVGVIHKYEGVEMVLVVVHTLVQTHTFKRQIIPMATVGLM